MTADAGTYQTTATEDVMEQTIREAVQHRGGVCFHVRDSRRLDVEGLPDLICMCPPVVWFVELKSQARRVTPVQRWVLGLLARCKGMRATIVRPHPKPGEMSLDDLLMALEDEAA